MLLFLTIGQEEENTMLNSPYQNVDFPKQTPEYYEYTNATTYPDGVVPVDNLGVFVRTKIQEGTYFKTEFEVGDSNLIVHIINY